MPRKATAPTSESTPNHQLDVLQVAASPIHGNGLFASNRIKKGSFIGTYEGPTAKKNGKYVLWTEDEDGNNEGRRGINKLRFLNHSAKPNTEFDGYDLFALRSIKPEAELTFNYGWDD